MARQCEQFRIYPKFLKSPLPTSSHFIESNPERSPLAWTPQFISSDKAREYIEAELSKFAAGESSQSPTYLLSSSSSGVGKTHLAYEAGQHVLYSIIIRVVKQWRWSPDNSSSDVYFSHPWVALTKLLDALLSQRNAALQRPSLSVEQQRQISASVSDIGLGLCRLLVLCYLDVTLLAFDAHIVQLGINLKKLRAGTKAYQQVFQSLRELCLRFHRNGPSEELVALSFLDECQLLGNFDLQDPAATHQLKKHVDDFEEILVERLKTYPCADLTYPGLLFCFDEVGPVVNKYPDFFISTNEVDEAKSDCKPNRALMYALVCTSSYLFEKRRWASYFTGTNFALFEVTQGIQLSQSRLRQRLVFPQHLLNVQDMVVILTTYFNLPKVLRPDQPQFRGLLHECRGRPLFFVDCILEVLLSHLGPKVDANAFFEACSLRICQHTNRCAEIILKYFDSRHASGLHYELIRAAVHNNGALVIGNKLKIFDGLIATGLCYFGEPHFHRGQKLDLTAEAITFQAILQACARIDFTSLAPLLIPKDMDPASKGRRAEVVLANYLAFTNFQALQSSNGRPVYLDVLLRNLLPEGIRLYTCLDGLTTKVSRAINCERITLIDGSRNFNPFLLFVAEKVSSMVSDEHQQALMCLGDFNEHVILYNIPQACGLDLAMLCCDAASGSVRLVGIQCKATATRTLDVVVQTLSPGAQFLTNDQRDWMQAIVLSQHQVDMKLRVKQQASPFCEPFPTSTTRGAFSRLWFEHMELALKYPQLFGNWLRVGITRQLPSKDLRSLITEYDSNYKLRPKRTDRERAVDSPFLLLSLQSGWLDEVVVEDLIDRRAEQLTAASNVWCPHGVADVLLAIKHNVPSEHKHNVPSEHKHRFDELMHAFKRLSRDPQQRLSLTR